MYACVYAKFSMHAMCYVFMHVDKLYVCLWVCVCVCVYVYVSVHMHTHVCAAYSGLIP